MPPKRVYLSDRKQRQLSLSAGSEKSNSKQTEASEDSEPSVRSALTSSVSSSLRNQRAQPPLQEERWSFSRAYESKRAAPKERKLVDRRIDPVLWGHNGAQPEATLGDEEKEGFKKKRGKKARREAMEIGSGAGREREALETITQRYRRRQRLLFEIAVLLFCFGFLIWLTFITFCPMALFRCPGQHLFTVVVAAWALLLGCVGLSLPLTFAASRGFGKVVGVMVAMISVLLCLGILRALVPSFRDLPVLPVSCNDASDSKGNPLSGTATKATSGPSSSSGDGGEAEMDGWIDSQEGTSKKREYVLKTPEDIQKILAGLSGQDESAHKTEATVYHLSPSKNSPSATSASPHNRRLQTTVQNDEETGRGETSHQPFFSLPQTALIFRIRREGISTFRFLTLSFWVTVRKPSGETQANPPTNILSLSCSSVGFHPTPHRFISSASESDSPSPPSTSTLSALEISTSPDPVENPPADVRHAQSGRLLLLDTFVSCD
uniref:Transmembrane protein n=1 Tax=Chromera velia CCMP2878 TaxID=1169474 RepID=A0A0K6S6V9_9ALVE|eukprot:Cvel_19452.t2-p1 / transcript=Cvel_19452.t2 / gene=Cvel_19452 / organism=Chromera_velia_CCMP2878 / gene_product=hypothetical protein / transcript_product=hypothetical protein / location=Cvel_scaffold1678:11680-13392(+) / protein_length=492 / sequence_SO=supercontig / SO=protein_coding / is_pseudo=false